MSKGNKITQSKLNYIIIIIGLIIAIIIAYLFLVPNVFKDENTKKEDEMIEQAKNYVLNNNISTTREIYFTADKLNVTLNDDCSFTSGVIYDGVNYIPNLMCKEYKSTVIPGNEEIRDYIILKGEEVMFVAKGMSFYDPGYISGDKIDVVGNVGTEEGVYNIYYKTKNSNNIAIRKVIILDNQELRNLFPSIALNGEELITIVEGRNYIEEGIIGTDSVDGDIKDKVRIEGEVNEFIPNEYQLTYILTNSRGYSNTITRKVVVIDKNSDLTISSVISPENYTNENVMIKLSVSGEFNKIIYPDGTEGKDLFYEVTENGTYKFIVYDIYDRIIEKEITIDNIDRTKPEGTCQATLYYDRTEVKVNITTKREISSYEYVIDDVSSNSTQTNSYVSNKVKPSTVRVKIKDSINNQNEIICKLESKLSRQIVTLAGGKNCLEGLVCYIQFNYGNSGSYPYCSMSNNPNSCGGIGRNGCSITSAANAIAAAGVKSSKGSVHTPYTVWEELYPINKRTGQCNGGCSGWSRIRDSVVNAGLTAPKSVTDLRNNTLSMITDHLKKGYPVIIRAASGPFTNNGHYMSLLGINEQGQVFLSDSANVSGTKKAVYKGKQYYVDTYINPSDLITGNVKEFLLVGPPGMYEGK